MESIITNFGFFFSISASIKSISVSPRNRMLFLFMLSLSALIFICSADSSPDMYRTTSSVWTLSHIWSINVDFPYSVVLLLIKLVNHLLVPLRSTLSSSPNPVDNLLISFDCTSFRAIGSKADIIIISIQN